MSFNDQLKHKAEEVHLQEKARDFGDAVAEVVKTALAAAAGYAAQNRPKVDEMLDKAEDVIARKAGPTHSDTVASVRGQVDKGIDKLVSTHGSASGNSGQEPSSSPGLDVPDDTFVAFPDDDEGAGHPS